MSMNVSLTPELEKFVADRVQSGMYHSASEVVREALRLLKDKDLLREVKLNELRHAIQQGKDSGDAQELDIEAFIQDSKQRTKQPQG
jgi:antitoxin ParD1/3/4